MIAGALFAELFVNNRAILVRYEGKLYLPTYGKMIPGKTFGLGYDYETDYRELKKRFRQDNAGNRVVLPPIPYNAFENDLRENQFPPFPPDFRTGHFLGTDAAGRDVAARLIYGFRIAVFFSLALLVADYAVGVSIGCAMGFFGGKFDLIFQRVIEIWSNIPFLYVVIIISSVVTPNFALLIAIMAFFGWISMTWIMRTVTYKEKAREYVLAATALGASNSRLILKHILPNTISIIVTYAPFSVSGGIVALTSLDYLGFGLPPPTPSWGELLQQGWSHMDAYWIAGSVILAMTVTLTTVTFIGEAVREAFDPKRYTVYE
jgi:microcin C transport system permease protein